MKRAQLRSPISLQGTDEMAFGSQANDVHYIAKRYEAEMLCARTASCAEARLAHEQMARAYAKCISADRRDKWRETERPGR